MAHADIHQQRAVVTLPGYFRPTKLRKAFTPRQRHDRASSVRANSNLARSVRRMVLTMKLILVVIKTPTRTTWPSVGA